MKTFTISLQKMILGLLTICLIACQEEVTVSSLHQSTLTSSQITPINKTGDVSTMATETSTLISSVKALPAAKGAPDGRGAMIPWWEYEAEEGQTNGQVIGPNRNPVWPEYAQIGTWLINLENNVAFWPTIAASSSGRKAVRLDQKGQMVSIKTQNSGQGVVIRYSMPDSKDGQGLHGSISLYINGQFNQRVALSSRYMWSYSLVGYWYNDYQNNPQAGLPHFPYDEVQVLLDKPIPAGAEVTLKIDEQDQLPWVVIDFIDIEAVAPLRSKPDHYLDLVNDCGGIANDQKDDSLNFNTCVSRAKQMNTGVYIPQGEFNLNTPFTDENAYPIANVPITGAGIWYSELNLRSALLCQSGACLVSHLRIRGDTIQRVYQWQALGLKGDDTLVDGIAGSAAVGSLIEDIWFEHVRSAWWVREAENVTLKNIRVRNTFADGINFYRSRNSRLTNATFRNTGDDAIAAWSHGLNQQGYPSENIEVTNNTVQLPRMMNCLAIYGGSNLLYENNLCVDVGAIGAGMMLSNMYDSLPFGPLVKIYNNSIIRGGSDNLGGLAGAITVQARTNTQIDHIELKGNQIIEPLYSGLAIGAGRGFGLEGKNGTVNLDVNDLEVIKPGTFAINIDSHQLGQIKIHDLRVDPSSKTPTLNNSSPVTYKVAFQ